jgi:acetyltransferase-like isoleucine patch superfamily enzyme
VFRLIFRVSRIAYIFINGIVNRLYCILLFELNGVNYSSFKCYGRPSVFLSRNTECVIGQGFLMNNGAFFSDSGQNGKCRIMVRDKAVLIIGNYVGMSDTTITCHERIEIGNYSMLGVGCQVRDSDSHSLSFEDRKNSILDWRNKRTSPVSIGESVFVGVNSIILKGVKIGNRSIIGAGSVVSKDVPADEIWAGNPAVFIRKNRPSEV